MTNALLDTAIAHREVLNKKGKGFANFAFIFKRAKPKNFLDKPCFAAISNDLNRPIYMVDWPFATLERKLGKPDLKYVNWLINDSFMAEAYLTKNAVDVIEHGAVLDCAHSAQYVITSAIALRYVKEFPFIVDNWNMASQYISGDDAFFFSHVIREGEQNKDVYTLSAYSIMGHSALGAYDRRAFTRIHKKEIITSLPSMTKKANYNGLSSILLTPQEHGGLKIKLPKITKYKMYSPFGKEYVYAGRHVDEANEWLNEMVETNLDR